MAVALNPSVAAGGSPKVLPSGKIVGPGEFYSTLPTPPDSQVNTMTTVQSGGINLYAEPSNDTTDPINLGGN